MTAKDGELHFGRGAQWFKLRYLSQFGQFRIRACITRGTSRIVWMKTCTLAKSSPKTALDRQERRASGANPHTGWNSRQLVLIM